jgi:virulence-associated protein VapD
MFAIAFDLVVADTAQHHPKGVSQAYADIGSTLGGFGFNRVQGSLRRVIQDENPASIRMRTAPPS